MTTPLDAAYADLDLLAQEVSKNGHKAGEAIPETTLAPSAPAAPWPTLADEALYGLLGDLVRAIDPETEADPAAVAVSILVQYGNAIGPTPHAMAEGRRHHANLFAVIVGDTASGKGSSYTRSRHPIELVDAEWGERAETTGLSSGEGLVNAVAARDEDEDRPPDKRLMVVETEFAGTLAVMNRERNILSVILRQAWDGGRMGVLTRTNPLRATGGHISVIGHVTPAELRRNMTNTDMLNGFANRFLWVLARSSKKLPEGGGVPRYGDAIPMLRDALVFASTLRPTVVRDEEAKALWASVYDELTDARPEPVGPILSRGAPQVLRISMLYALLDLSTEVRVEHLRAALALWRYCEQSAAYIFGGGELAISLADRILNALVEVGDEGLSTSQINVALQNHVRASVRDAELASLVKEKRIRMERIPGEGKKPKVVYYAVPTETE